MLSKALLIRCVYAFLGVICLCFPVYAQPDEINFTSITSKDGLSGNVVTAILKDRQGLMWFATEDGLNKYNGTGFTVYRHNPSNKQSILSNDVRSLHEDKAGNLWVGTNGGGLSLYNRKTDTFKHFHLSAGTDEYNVYRSICSDYLGQLWVGTSDGLVVFNPKTNKIYKYRYAPKRFRLLSQNISCVFEDSQRRMWVGAEDGLFLYDRKTNSFFSYINSPNDDRSLSGNYVQTIAEDKKGRIWIGTRDGLNLLMPDGKTFKRIKKGGNAGHSLSNNIVNSVALNDNGDLWIGTNDGLDILDVETGDIKVYLPNHRNINSLTSGSIKYIYIDNGGISWLGTFRGGISKYNKNLNLFNYKPYIPFDEQGLSAPIVTSFAEKDHDNVFVGTDGGGLNIFNRKNALFKPVNLPSGAVASSKLAVLALQMSSDKKLWVGTYANGLFMVDPKTGVSRHYTTSDHLTSNNIFCIAEDSKGNVWIGTNGGGVNVYHPGESKFSAYTPTDKINSEYYLPINGFIRTIAEDASDNIWIGSYGSGLAILNPVTKKMKVYDKVNSNLSSNFVLSLLKDKKNRMWIGTMGGGLCLFNAKTNEFSSFSEKEGLCNAVVYKIVEDEAGLLWLSTNTGLSSFDPKTRKFHNYNRHNGVQNNNFVLGSGLRLSDGEIFFGGLEGLNHFYPKHIKNIPNVPQVLLTELKVDNESIVPSETGSINEHISVAKTVNLNYKQNFSLSFVPLSYTTPQQYSYAYKLEGFDKNWNNNVLTKTTSYTNIDPGDYVFKVRAKNLDGSLTGQTTTLNIHIEPPFWRTTYAYVFYVLGFAGVLFYIRYRGILKIEKKFKLERERSEVERLRELDNLKIKFLTNLSHEFRTPISLIMGPVERLLAENKDERSAKQINMISRNARRLLNLVNQLLDFRKMEEHELSLNLAEGDIASFIAEVANSFADLSERKNVNLKLENKIGQFYSNFDHDKIERILFNLLSNAFKFTPEGGAIIIELDKQEATEQFQQEGITIKVIDNGIGIAADRKDKIFDNFFQAESKSLYLNQGTGIGLSITKEFVNMHGGTIAVESEPDKGTTFSVRLPLSPITCVGSDKNSSELEITNLLPIEELDRSEQTEDSGLDKPSILIVEDNEDFRFYLKDNLRGLYKVYEASNGKEGWQKTLAHHPLVIITDLNMPIMNGIDFCIKVRSDKRTQHMPVIMLTALSGENEHVKSLSIGANDYITKPFNFELLNAKIKNLLVQNQRIKNTYRKQVKIQSNELEIEFANEKFLNKVMVYIENNLNKPQLSVEDLSKHLGMTRVTLYHKVLEITGQSPVEYIRSVKLNKATVLLEKSDMNVSEIAYAVGFGSPHYFAKAFKNKFNIQPTEYINLKRKKVKAL